MIRALDSWFRALTVDQRRAAEKAFTLNYLLDMHAVWRRDTGDGSSDVPAPDPGPLPKQPPAPVVEPEPVDEQDEASSASVSVLRFRSESDSWSKPPIPAEITGPERFPSMPRRATPTAPVQRFGPVEVSRVEDRPAEAPVAEPIPVAPRVPVQQESRKIARHRQFGALENSYTLGGVTIREADLTTREIPLRLRQLEDEKRRHGERLTHHESRIARREELNVEERKVAALERVRLAEIDADRDRLAAANRVLTAYPEAAKIADLDEQDLIECGYERRTA